VRCGWAGLLLPAQLGEWMQCQGREILRLVSESPFADEPVRPDVVHFVSVLSKSPRSAPPTPISFPDSGTWLLKILGRDGRSSSACTGAR
jgi:hypothetical protein